MLSFFFLCVLLQMTGHKRILSIVYARWLVGPSCAQWHNWKGTLDWRQYGGQSYERAHHKTDARKIKANGFWLTCFDQMQSYFISIKRITSIVSFILFCLPSRSRSQRHLSWGWQEYAAEARCQILDRWYGSHAGSEEWNRATEQIPRLTIGISNLRSLPAGVAWLITVEEEEQQTVRVNCTNSKRQQVSS